jgi:hypothetical protein
VRDPKDCPRFEHGDREMWDSIKKILEWSGAQIEFDPDPVSVGGNPNKPRKPIPPYWGASWEYGWFGNLGLRELSDKPWMELYTALIIFLWSHKTGFELAEHLAHAYMMNLKRFYQEKNISIEGV